MAYNFQDIDPENIDFQQQSDEARKKRLAMLAALASGGTMPEVAGQALMNRAAQAGTSLEQAGQTVMNPEQRFQDRLTELQQSGQRLQPTQPVQPQPVQPQPLTGQLPQPQPMPEQMAQEMQQQTQVPVKPAEPIQQPQPQVQAQTEQAGPVAPVNPQETQLPQAGPGVQVASTQPGVGLNEAQKAQDAVKQQQAQQQAQQAAPSWHDQLVTGNFGSLTNLIQSPETPDDVKSEAKDRLWNMMNDQRLQAQANKTIDGAMSGNQRAVSDLTKELSKKSTEGSYLKAMLYSRLGLNELAKDEQQKLGAGVKYQAVVGPDNTRALIKYGADNMPISGFDETGKQISQESLAKFAANALPTQAHLMPSVHGGTVVNGRGEIGTVMYDPRSQQTYVQVGSERRAPQGWTTLSQNPEAVAGAAAAKKGAELKTEGYIPSGPGTTGGFSDPSIKVISGQRSTPEQQRLYELSVANGTPGTLPNGNPVAKPGTSQHEGQGALDIDSKLLTRAGRQELASKGYYQPLPNDPNHWEVIPGFKPQNAPATPTVGQQKIAEKVAGERTQAFNKILDEEVRPQAQNGDTIVNTRKQQFALFDRPGVDASKIFGIANGSGQAPGDQRWTMLRDVLIGKTTATDDQIRERAAQLGLNREEQSALAEYNIANAKINAATLKQTAGAGSVSDAEQRANREMNIDPTKVPALGAYNAMAQSQFNGDLARYKADWAATHPATNALQLDKAWRKETQKLTDMYANIAKDRVKFIVDNGSSAAAVKEAYKRYPIPEYDPQTETWKKTKSLAQILGK